MATKHSTPYLDPRPPLPIPDIPLLLNRFGNAAEPFVSPELLSSYNDAISTLFTREEAQEVLGSLNEKETNWSNAWFVKLLLGTRWHVPTSTRLSTLINVPEPTRERKLATLLRAVGIWSREYVFGDGSRYTAAQKRLEHQLRGLCGTFRVPRFLNTCTLEHSVPEETLHAVVWWCGSAWKVTVVGEDGMVLSVDDIERQIQEVLKTQPEHKIEPSIASLSWRLGRQEWHHQRAAYEKIPENATSISTLYSAIVTVALEGYPAPTETADRLNDVRTGGTSENRFADQTFAIVSYSDGEMGLAFDHAPSDCGPAMELSIILLEIINSTSSLPTSTAPSIIEPLKFTPPKSSSALNLPESVVEAIPRTVITIDIPPKTPGTPRPHVSSRLCDTVANLALQSAILRTSGTIPPMFQPVIIRDFYHGRCDSMIPVTLESLAFIRLAFPSQPQPQDKKEHTEELYNAFAAACKKRKEIIMRTQDGLTTKYFSQGYLYPKLERMAKEIPPESQTSGFKAVLDVFRKVSGHTSAEGDPTVSIQFTGFTTPTDDIYAGLSNIYLPNQLVIFYLQKPNGTLTVSFSGTGVYRNELEKIVRGYKESYEVISKIVDEYVEHLANVTPPPRLS